MYFSDRGSGPQHSPCDLTQYLLCTSMSRIPIATNTVQSSMLMEDGWVHITDIGFRCILEPGCGQDREANRMRTLFPEFTRDLFFLTLCLEMPMVQVPGCKASERILKDIEKMQKTKKQNKRSATEWDPKVSTCAHCLLLLKSWVS